MVWNKTQPTGSSKIRNAPDLITDNWAAIEAGDPTLKYEKLNLNKQSVDPTEITDAFILFAKANTSGDTQLFGKDSDGASIQLTNGSPTIAENGECFLPGGIILKWGTTSLSNTRIFRPYSTPFPTNTLAVMLTYYDPLQVGLESYGFVANGYEAGGFYGYFAYNGSRVFKYLAVGY